MKESKDLKKFIKTEECKRTKKCDKDDPQYVYVYSTDKQTINDPTTGANNTFIVLFDQNGPISNCIRHNTKINKGAIRLRQEGIYNVKFFVEVSDPIPAVGLAFALFLEKDNCGAKEVTGTRFDVVNNVVNADTKICVSSCSTLTLRLVNTGPTVPTVTLASNVMGSVNVSLDAVRLANKSTSTCCPCV